jgi:putative 4-mercaptohistidine N1-methyltranferase
MKNTSLQTRGLGKASLTACFAHYESNAAVAQYCDAHYGPDKFGVPNFQAHLARLCASELSGKQRRSALDLGCAVGRASFELATCFDHVTGIDFSSRFINIARRLKVRGRIGYKLIEEGELVSDHEVCLADLGLAATATKVTFCQGNAERLNAHSHCYDLVLAANLIDRLPEPGKFLAGIHKVLVVGGLLVITSPYNWLEHFTTRHQWLGGRFRIGSPFTSQEGLTKKLTRYFVEVSEPQDVEFVIRKTARTFQHNISQVTFWRRVR